MLVNGSSNAGTWQYYHTRQESMNRSAGFHRRPSIHRPMSPVLPRNHSFCATLILIVSSEERDTSTCRGGERRRPFRIWLLSMKDERRGRSVPLQPIAGHHHTRIFQPKAHNLQQKQNAEPGQLLVKVSVCFSLRLTCQAQAAERERDV